MSEELQPQNPEGVQPQGGQGTPPEPQEPQQTLDYEKAYKNLEPEFTRKSQELKTLEGWKKFQERTGVTPDQALQQLEMYDPQPQTPYQQPQAPNYDQFMDPNGTSFQQQPQQFQSYPQYQQPSAFNDPRISQMEQQLNQMQRNAQAQQLRQKFPQFDEYYTDVVNLADQNGMDLESAWGRIMVNRFDDIIGKQKQQVVDNIRQKGDKALESSASAGDATDPTAGLTPQEVEIAQTFGMSPQDYAQAKQGYTIND